MENSSSLKQTNSKGKIMSPFDQLYVNYIVPFQTKASTITQSSEKKKVDPKHIETNRLMQQKHHKLSI